MVTLKQQQSAFGHALRHADASALTPDGSAHFAERFDTYRNNAWQFFATALELTYPVLLRRVGPEFLRQLAREYRDSHPSRRGDLHWVGADFPGWLDTRLAGTGYEWLADLARLEWACSDAAIAATAPSMAMSALGAHAPESLADLRLSLQPSLRLLESKYPVWSVWQANQDDAASPVDLNLGGEFCVVACSDDRPVVYRIGAIDYRVLERLRQGNTLGDALEAADPEALGRVLGWAFSERLVTGISSGIRTALEAETLSPSGPASR